ncbi:hypothetical protein DID88_004069 [Monilinia fructigena]|uniref:Uncharacterized protein n=1 Tax=Monilinia fructigena TaxID=38457 RepID=A0A395IRR5_9HELO|nr:hypothetical protein DID88_004069 [Monilinia fructigena]
MAAIPPRQSLRGMFSTWKDYFLPPPIIPVHVPVVPQKNKPLSEQEIARLRRQQAKAIDKYFDEELDKSNFDEIKTRIESWSNEVQAVRDQQSKEYYDNLSPGGAFDGELDNLATKVTMVHFGLPVAPMTLNNIMILTPEWADTEDDEEDPIATLPRQQRIIYSEKPLEFLDSYIERGFGYQIMRRPRVNMRGGAESIEELNPEDKSHFEWGSNVNMRGSSGEPLQGFYLDLLGPRPKLKLRRTHMTHDEFLASAHELIECPEGSDWAFNVDIYRQTDPRKIDIPLEASYPIDSIADFEERWIEIVETIGKVDHDQLTIIIEEERFQDEQAHRRSMNIWPDNLQIVRLFNAPERAETYWKVPSDLEADYCLNSLQPAFVRAFLAFLDKTAPIAMCDSPINTERVTLNILLVFGGMEVTRETWDWVREQIEERRKNPPVAGANPLSCELDITVPDLDPKIKPEDALSLHLIEREENSPPVILQVDRRDENSEQIRKLREAFSGRVQTFTNIWFRPEYRVFTIHDLKEPARVWQWNTTDEQHNTSLQNFRDNTREMYDDWDPALDSNFVVTYPSNARCSPVDLNPVPMPPIVDPTQQPRINKTRLILPVAEKPITPKWETWMTDQHRQDALQRRSYIQDQSVIEPGLDPSAPAYGPSKELSLGVSSSTPTVYMQRLTTTDIMQLAEENQKLRNGLLERTHNCPICSVSMSGYEHGEIQRHFGQHLVQLQREGQCPLCEREAWSIMTMEQKKEHLETHQVEADTEMIRNFLERYTCLDKPDRGPLDPEPSFCGDCGQNRTAEDEEERGLHVVNYLEDLIERIWIAPRPLTGPLALTDAPNSTTFFLLIVRFLAVERKLLSPAPNPEIICTSLIIIVTATRQAFGDVLSAARTSRIGTARDPNKLQRLLEHFEKANAMNALTAQRNITPIPELGSKSASRATGAGAGSYQHDSDALKTGYAYQQAWFPSNKDDLYDSIENYDYDYTQDDEELLEASRLRRTRKPHRKKLSRAYPTTPSNPPPPRHPRKTQTRTLIPDEIPQSHLNPTPSKTHQTPRNLYPQSITFT